MRASDMGLTFQILNYIEHMPMQIRFSVFT
jgi:hypothetical protein